MESDDERSDPHAFRKMLNLLVKNSAWDGVSCMVSLCGAPDRQRMQAYVDWQNSLLEPAHMAAGRFIEIPALHQTAIFRRHVVDEIIASNCARYRDGPWYGAQRGEGAHSQTVHVQAHTASDGSERSPAVTRDFSGGEAGGGIPATEMELQQREDIHGDAIDTPVDLWKGTRGAGGPKVAFEDSKVASV
eukprot:scaffold31180_cov40-Tisochrysis_lutea.AAC.2